MGSALLHNRKARTTFTHLPFSKKTVGDSGAVALVELLIAPLGIAMYARSARCKLFFVNNNIHAQFYIVFSLCRPIALERQLAVTNDCGTVRRCR